MSGPPYLPVITVITDSTGASISPASELRIMASLVATPVTGDGPDRIELKTYEDPSGLRPFKVPVAQPAIAAGIATGGGTRTILAYADTGSPSYFTGAVMVAGGALAGSNTNYADFGIWEFDITTGLAVGAVKVTGTTKATGSGSTGSWTGGKAAIDVGLGFDVAAGNYLGVEWGTNHNAGVDMPGGSWRIT